jgi:hypothetical protein
MTGHVLNQAHETAFTNFRFNMTMIDEMMDEKESISSNNGKPF